MASCVSLVRRPRARVGVPRKTILSTYDSFLHVQDLRHLALYDDWHVDDCVQELHLWHLHNVLHRLDGGRLASQHNWHMYDLVHVLNLWHFHRFLHSLNDVNGSLHHNGNIDHLVFVLHLRNFPTSLNSFDCGNSPLQYNGYIDKSVNELQPRSLDHLSHWPPTLKHFQCLLFCLDGQCLVLLQNWDIDDCRHQHLLRHHLRHGHWAINHLRDRLGTGTSMTCSRSSLVVAEISRSSTRIASVSS